MFPKYIRISILHLISIVLCFIHRLRDSELQLLSLYILLYMWSNLKNFIVDETHNFILENTQTAKKLKQTSNYICSLSIVS